MTLRLLIATVWLASMTSTLGVADARSHSEARRGVPAMVARVLPAVVSSITTRQIARDQLDRPVVTPGVGSGIIIDTRGHILTNDHVVQGVDQIRIGLADERPFRARLVGRDAFTDLTSAHGIGFAIPINNAKLVIKALISGGRIARTSLGLFAVSLTPQLADMYDLVLDRGALITRVEAGGPAERAGIEPGDMITAADGGPVKNLHHLHDRMAARRAGDPFPLQVWRNGHTLTRTAVLEEYR